MEEKVKEVSGHPLMHWVPESSVTPRQWLLEFATAKSVYHKLGLLQFGLDLKSGHGGYGDVIKTYFAVAEGHAGNVQICGYSPDSNDYRQDMPFGEKRMRDLHQVIARKAFEMICARILKNTVKSESDVPSWAAFVQNEENLNMLLHFFRLKEDPSDRPRFVNLKYFGPQDGGHDHHTMIAVNFLKDLVNRTWPTNDHYPRQWDYEEIKQMFRSKRQKMIEILHGLFLLSLLWNRSRALQINGSHMKWLKDMALKESKCATVEEAVYKMNQAARTWHILSVIRQEHGRQIEIQRAKQRAADAEVELKRLSA